ncbi:MAG: hypothetical protein NVS4B6_31080 [Mycobacterium sp.]
MQESAETVYIRQHATIQAAIESLQCILDEMLDPTDNEITWADVAHHAHIVDALMRAELA